MNSIISYFESGTVVERDKYHVAYELANADGDGRVAIFPILPGVEVMELHYSGSRYRPAILKHQTDIIEIHYCCKGRAECRMLDGCFLYIGDGDIFMNTIRGRSDSVAMPLGYYLGVSVVVDLSAAADTIRNLIPEDPIDIHSLAYRYFTNDECLFIEKSEEIQHIFSGIFTLPAYARSTYYRLKFQELLLCMHYYNIPEERQKIKYSRKQVDIVKQIQRKMTLNLSKRFTIEELAQQHCISATALKSNFKSVYGVSIAAYMREYRIRQAAILLRQTGKSISEIAAEMGYVSQSKFGAAFKSIMTFAPLEYRNHWMNAHNPES